MKMAVRVSPGAMGPSLVRPFFTLSFSSDRFFSAANAS